MASFFIFSLLLILSTMASFAIVNTTPLSLLSPSPSPNSPFSLLSPSPSPSPSPNFPLSLLPPSPPIIDSIVNFVRNPSFRIIRFHQRLITLFNSPYFIPDDEVFFPDKIFLINNESAANLSLKWSPRPYPLLFHYGVDWSKFNKTTPEISSEISPAPPEKSSEMCPVREFVTTLEISSEMCPATKFVTSPENSPEISPAPESVTTPATERIPFKISPVEIVTTFAMYLFAILYFCYFKGRIGPAFRELLERADEVLEGRADEVLEDEERED